MEAGLQPAGQQLGGRVVGLGLHGRRHDRHPRLVQGRGEHRAPRGQPGPGEVGVAGRVRAGAGLKIRQRCLGGVQVGDPPLCQRAQRVLGGVLRRVHRPPHDDRGVRQQQRQHHRVGVVGHLAVHAQDDGLAGTGVGAHPEFGVEVGAGAVARGAGVPLDDDQRARGVLVRGLLGRLDRVVGVLLVRDDDHRQDHAHGRRADRAAALHQRLVDLACRGVGQVDLHGLRQLRPSRASISSASSGPQLPDAYCAGAPCVSQYSSMGSRIFQDSSTSW